MKARVKLAIRDTALVAALLYGYFFAYQLAVKLFHIHL